MTGEEAIQPSLKVWRLSVKPVRDALENHGFLDRSIKITPFPLDDKYSIVPLKTSCGLELRDEADQDEDQLNDFLSSIGIEQHLKNVTLFSRKMLQSRDRMESQYQNSLPVRDSTKKTAKGNLLKASINEWQSSIPVSTTTETANEFSIHESAAYGVYPPMLLLAPAVLSNFLQNEELSKRLPQLYERLCKAFKVSHIALNAPIPSAISTEGEDASTSPSPNIMRSPTSLTPLHGDFGEALPASHSPTVADFESAFWCSTRQNGIFQTWAPRYTMFSRGNISEKARILKAAENTHMIKDSTAVDLYAGIGYFAFSYVKAGYARVLCWEINPWSVEGLKRGAKANNWKTVTASEDEDGQALSRRIAEECPRLVIFPENNQKALSWIHELKSHLPVESWGPIRHVNCGYLPSSRDSWKTAVDVLDKDVGGWIHVHENIRESEIDVRKAQIVEIFKSLTEEKFALKHGTGSSGYYHVSCSHLERVKSYAPHLIHCVLDIVVVPFYQ